MRRDDYIMMMTAGLLTIPAASFENSLQHFGHQYSLTKLRAPKAVSVGGKNSAQDEVPLTAWLTSLRAESIENVSFFHYESDLQRPPSHLAAAFAGSVSLLMSVKTAVAVRTFFLQTYMSSQYEITAEQFVAVIDAQSLHEKLWARVASIVLQSNSMNGRPSFDAADIKAYLVDDGKNDLDFLYSQLLQEVQVECAVEERAFAIPSRYASLFEKSTFSLGTERDSVFLYPTCDVTPQQLLTLIDAQTTRSDVWKEFVSDLSNYPIQDIPACTAEEWPSKLSTLTREQLSTVANLVCRTICTLCEERNEKRVIPTSLEGSFGPDELEHRRAQARSRASHEQWYLQRNQNPWEAYIFTLIPEIQALPQVSLEKKKKEFMHALEDIAAFANKIGSPFEEAFRLALFSLSEAMPSGEFHSKHLNAIRQVLREKKFSERAVENFAAALQYAGDMTMLAFDEVKIRSLIAVSIADVFGGMGSWNDQYVEGEQETLERLSAALFSSLKAFFASSLSS